MQTGQCWIARRRWRVDPAKVSHARMLKGGSNAASTAEKDRFLCFWFRTPGSSDVPVHFHPIAQDEAHLVIRLDPQWCYRTQRFVPATSVRRVERNLDEQFTWGEKIFEAYVQSGLSHPTSYHMIGPKRSDSAFSLRRVEP